MKPHTAQSRLFFGVFILLFGVLALVDNLGIFSRRDILPFWPVIFIVLGAYKISQSKEPNSYFVGGALVLAGSLMVLNHIGVLFFRLRDWWPLLLIGVGVMVIFKDKINHRMSDLNQDVTTVNLTKNEDASNSAQEAKIDIVTIMSGSQGNIASQNFRGGAITAIMAGVELDLRNASIQGDAVIDVFAVWGGITLRIPSDWSVVNNGSAILGGIQDSTIPPMTANKRLIISGTAIMGGVEIKN
ncbi:MAG: cell wall-active antibiotics response protein [Undibacterium sp.]|nr:cell wall-active antibiotics response protein [Undibacterium sp.]